MQAIKKFLKSSLPGSLVHSIQKVRYARTIRGVTENSEPDMKVIKRLLRSGDYVVDLGANLGFYTKFLSERVGGEGRVFSIEPIPDTVDILRYMTKKLGLNNVEIFDCAVSEQNGQVVMEIPLFNTGEDNIFEARIVSGDTQSPFKKVTVQTKTMDTLFANKAKKISFVKCDVEGHELSCLKGSSSLLKDAKPAWMIEVWGSPDDANAAGHRTFDFLKVHGYDAYWFNGSELRKRIAGEVSTSSNYFFLTSNHVELVRGQGMNVNGA